MMYIKSATQRDLETFKIHPEDLAEFNANNPNRNLIEVLKEHIASTNGVAMQWCDDNACMPVAIGGNHGDCVWFITSHLVDFMAPQCKREFRKAILEYRNKMLERYPVLWNYVWTGNNHHIRFLRTIGAEFTDEYITSSITGETFRLFLIRRERCVSQ